jgi:hypothetical protein
MFLQRNFNVCDDHLMVSIHSGNQLGACWSNYTWFFLCCCYVLRWIWCLWCYSDCISTPGQAWKICLATVGIEPTTFGILLGHFAERHFAEGYFAERTFFRMDILRNRRFAERTVCRKNNLPKIEMLFRQNVWDCASFLNFVILNHLCKITIIWLLAVHGSLAVHNHIDYWFDVRL